VWWLYEGGRPYLAEVFKQGAIPDCRLPYLDRSTIKGKDVTRALGQQAPRIRLVAPSSRRFPYTEWYEHNSHYCSLRGVCTCNICALRCKETPAVVKTEWYACMPAQEFESAESSVSDKQQSDDVKGDFGGCGLCRRTTFTGGVRSSCAALHED
jgi:hypothetical protein